MCVLFDDVCVHLLRYKDINVSYSRFTRTGHGQCHMVFEDNARGYYMCWYARDLLLSWRQARVPQDDANLDRADPGPHAPNPERAWYYYRVSFCGMDGGHTGQVPGGQFGTPLGNAECRPVPWLDGRGQALAGAHDQEPGAQAVASPLRRHHHPGMWSGYVLDHYALASRP